MAVETQPLTNDGYPEGEALQRKILARQRRGALWRTLFLGSTLLAILTLIVLLYNIINSAFGYVAVQNKIDPTTLVQNVEEQRMLTAPNVAASEDDNVLAKGIGDDPNAIGFFGYAYYQAHASQLKVLTVDGVMPGAETLNTNKYPLARPLFIYTTAEILQKKPQVAAFVNYYLTNVNQEISNVGYFPASEQALTAALATVQTAAKASTAQKGVSGDIALAGSSTVYPLTQRMMEKFKTSGYSGKAVLENIGTKAGFVRFCSGQGVDIANASRAIQRPEIELCRKAKREPLELRIGTDALAIVVSQKNSFLKDVTQEQLRLIFTDAKNWSEVNPAWPQTPIKRLIPGKNSGTLDFLAETIFGRKLEELPKATLLTLLESNVSKGLMRRFEAEQPFAQRTQENIYALVLDRVIDRKVVRSWTLTESIFKQNEINTAVLTIPNGELQFRSWISKDFVINPQSPVPDQAGVRTAVLGSLWMIFLTLLFALPIGVGAAIYLEEYATDNRLNRLIQTNINNLAGVPSIIYGMLGLAIFVRLLEPITSGKLFGLADATTANGRTILSASLTLALLVLPLIIINAQEAIRAVPKTLREAGYGLGATKWQVIWSHVLPSALPGILTGNILALSRAIGETAPLVVIGASTFVALDPTGPFSKFTSLPVQIYQWTERPQDQFRNIAAAAIIILLVLLLTLNASAVILRNQYGKRA